MRICVYHPTMGQVLAAEISEAFPQAHIRIERDSKTDPSQRETLEVLVANTFPPGLLGRCPQLRLLHLTGSGTDHLASGRPRADLLVTTSSTVPASAVAEFAWMGVMALAKDAVRMVEHQQQRLWQLPDARLLAGSRLLLVGLGRIGAQIARRARGLDVRVTAVTRTAAAHPDADTVVPPDRLPAEAARADHLVVAVPGTPLTRHLVDARVIGALPDHATLVNVARSSVVDVDALVAALRAGRLRGALLDVHDQEPLPADSPLWSVPRLWVTPHGAYRFPEEEREVARLVVHNLRALHGVGSLRNQVPVPAEAPSLPSVTSIRS